MQPRVLGRIQGGVSAGIEIQQYRKHSRIDPTRYSNPYLLQRDTDPKGRGSKWLHTVSDQEEFDLVRQVLETHGVGLGGPRGQYKGVPQPRFVGISGGKEVRTVQVEFDGRYAHGFPCEP